MKRAARTTAAIVWLAAAVGSGCDRGDMDGRNAAGAAPPAAASAAPATGMSTMVHGNHDPKYGGVVLMNGDLHFEAVLAPSGQYHVYFSDAGRNELPASMASAVTITVTRQGEAPEVVALQIDDAGESWIGQGRPVPDPATMARIAYSFRGQPYWIDVPFSVVRTATSS